jgi:hypothetical protein
MRLESKNKRYSLHETENSAYKCGFFFNCYEYLLLEEATLLYRQSQKAPLSVD